MIRPGVRGRVFTAAVALLVACADPAEPLGDAPQSMRTVRDPGPPPNDETPPIRTLYLGAGLSARPVARVIDVAPGAAAMVLADGTLRIGDRTVDTAVRPGLSVSAQGQLAYVKGGAAAQTDLWLVSLAGGPPRAFTHDGRSERPFFLPDGALLYTSSAGSGKVGWFRDGRRLNAYPQTRVPAFPDRTRWDAATGQVLFDAGDAVYALDPQTGVTTQAEPRP